MNVWKMLRIILFSVSHFGLMFIFMIAAAFQLRIIDIPDGGEANWYQLIIPSIWGILISPFVTLCSVLLPKDFIKNTPFSYLQFIINSIIWGFFIEGLINFLDNRKIRKDFQNESNRSQLSVIGKRKDVNRAKLKSIK